MMRKISTFLIIISVIVCLILPNLNCVSAAENEWVSKADMPTARGYLHVATVDGKMYAIGGSGPIGTNEEYDPQNDTWATKTPMPFPEQNFAVAAYQNKIYCIGGEDKNQVYDPATDTWEIKADMPTARYTVQ
jgi:N-acetylneuraminic acid mutarotase